MIAPPSPETAAGPRRRALLSVAALGLAAVLVYLAVGRLPSLGTVEADAAAGFALTFPVLAALAWVVIRSPLSAKVLGLLLVLGLAAGLLLSWLQWFALADPFKVVAAVAAGRLLATQLEEVWILLLIAVIAIVADIWSVFAGPTKVVVERAPDVLGYLLVHFPLVGGSSPGVALGMSDFVFLGLLTYGSGGVGLRRGATFLAMTASVAVTLAITLTTRRSLPALPLLSAAFLLVNVDLLWARRPWQKDAAA